MAIARLETATTKTTTIAMAGVSRGCRLPSRVAAEASPPLSPLRLPPTPPPPQTRQRCMTRNQWRGTSRCSSAFTLLLLGILLLFPAAALATYGSPSYHHYHGPHQQPPSSGAQSPAGGSGQQRRTHRPPPPPSPTEAELSMQRQARFHESSERKIGDLVPSDYDRANVPRHSAGRAGSPLLEVEARKMHLLFESEWSKRIPRPDGQIGTQIRRLIADRAVLSREQAVKLTTLLDGYWEVRHTQNVHVWTRLAIADGSVSAFSRFYRASLALEDFGESGEGEEDVRQTLRFYLQRGHLWQADTKTSGTAFQRTYIDHSVLLFDAAVLNRPDIAEFLMRQYDYPQEVIDMAFYLSICSVFNAINEHGVVVRGKRYEFENCKLFYVNGADLNAMGDAAVYSAIRMNDVNILYFLRYFGASLLTSDRSRPPILYAWQYGCKDAIKFIMSKIHKNRMVKLIWLHGNTPIFQDISEINDSMEKDPLEPLDLPWLSIYLHNVPNIRCKSRRRNQCTIRLVNGKVVVSNLSPSSSTDLSSPSPSRFHIANQCFDWVKGVASTPAGKVILTAAGVSLMGMLLSLRSKSSSAAMHSAHTPPNSVNGKSQRRQHGNGGGRGGGRGSVRHAGNSRRPRSVENEEPGDWSPFSYHHHPPVSTPPRWNQNEHPEQPPVVGPSQFPGCGHQLGGCLE